MRKPSPISISSPRLITTSRPPASAARLSSTAAALLFTASPGLGAGQLCQQPAEVVVARAARAGVEVVLQVGVAAGNRATRSSAAVGEGRPAEVGVHDDAGCVQHRTQAGGAVEQLLHPREELLWRPGLAGGPGLGECRADRRDRRRAPVALGGVVGQAEQRVDRWELA